MSSTDSRNVYPVLAMLFGASMWGVIWYPMRLLEDGGLHGLWLLLLLYFTALIVSLPWTWRHAGELARTPALIGAMILAGGWTNVAFTLAILDGNVLRVMLLFYLSPLWATLLGWLFLRERVSAAAVWNLALAMVGAVIMLWSPEHGVPWPQDRPDWLALSAGFAFAASNTAVRKAARLSIETKTVCVCIGVCVVCVILLPFSAVPWPRIESSVFTSAVALGVGGILLVTVAVQYAATHLPVHQSAVLALIELVVGAVSQQVLTDEVVGVREWIGGSLIVLGAYLTARAAAKAR